MPILSIYFGVSQTTFVLIRSQKSEPEVYIYPYAYPTSKLTSLNGLITESAFYSELVTLILNDFGLKPSACDILLCGYPRVPKLISSLNRNLNKKTKVAKVKDSVDISTSEGIITPALHLTLDALLQDISGIDLLLLDNFKLVMGHEMASSFFIKKAILTETDANSTLYPHLQPQFAFGDMETASYKDSSNLRSAPQQVKLYISGDRFHMPANDIDVRATTYMLLFDILKTPGFFDLTIDSSNILINLLLLAHHKPEFHKLFLDYQFDSLGTLINTPGQTECLIKRNSGNSQLITIPTNNLYLLPLGKSDRATILLKSHLLGKFEKVVSGGTLGVVIDTRDKTKPFVWNEALYKTGLSPIILGLRGTF